MKRFNHFRTRTPKGDGNHRTSVHLTKPAQPFQNTNPERGRKLDMCEVKTSERVAFQNTNPERGRKPYLHPLSINAHEIISEHEPRKGTETWGNRNEYFCHVKISEHEPRKGTETPKLIGAFVRKFLIFQNTNPERGRKL